MLSLRRKDIDGLRGLAIAGVVLFHFFPSIAPGGFAGVDVFFVISGYLISRLLMKSLEDGHFTFLHFYARRVRRLLPALLLVLSSCLCFGWFTLLYGEYRQLAKHAAGGLAFIANFIFLKEAGYFDLSAQAKPLLHLWSLGIEEQFYLFCPILFWLLHRLRIQILWAVLPLFVASLTFYQLTLQSDPTTAFFSPLTRAWEIAAGSIVAAVLSSEPRFPKLLVNFLSGMGFSLVAFSFPFATHPLIPVLGACAMILARENALLNRSLLSHPLSVGLGAISYPLYLWHWPIRSFSQILYPQWQSTPALIGYIGLATALAAATYRFWEKPVQTKAWNRPLAFVVPATLASAVLAAFSLGVFLEKITSPTQRASEALAKYDFLNGKTEAEFFADHACHLFSGRFDEPKRAECTQKEFPDRPTVMMVGDSFGGYLSLGLRPYLKEKRFNFMQLTMVWCTPFDENDFESRCAQNSRYLMGKIREIRPDFLLVFVSFNLWSDRPLPMALPNYFAQKLNEMAPSAKRVILLGQMPEWEGGLPNAVGRFYSSQRKPVPRAMREGLAQRPDRDLEILAQPLAANVEILAMKQSLCRGDGCLVTIQNKRGEPALIAFDHAHLTQAGAEYVAASIVGPRLIARDLAGKLQSSKF